MIFWFHQDSSFCRQIWLEGVLVWYSCDLWIVLVESPRCIEMHLQNIWVLCSNVLHSLFPHKNYICFHFLLFLLASPRNVHFSTKTHFYYFMIKKIKNTLLNVWLSKSLTKLLTAGWDLESCLNSTLLMFDWNYIGFNCIYNSLVENLSVLL